VPTPKVKRKRRFWTRGLVEDARDVDMDMPELDGLPDTENAMSDKRDQDLAALGSSPKRSCPDCPVEQARSIPCRACFKVWPDRG
jgi:hypothetical protein